MKPVSKVQKQAISRNLNIETDMPKAMQTYGKLLNYRQMAGRTPFRPTAVIHSQIPITYFPGGQS